VVPSENKVERLERIISKECSRTPVRVEVDQTGYIKYHKSGMYILDENGDGFELTNGEIQVLTRNGIITF
jgi:hypothetical protein